MKATDSQLRALDILMDLTDTSPTEAMAEIDVRDDRCLDELSEEEAGKLLVALGRMAQGSVGR